MSATFNFKEGDSMLAFYRRLKRICQNCFVTLKKIDALLKRLKYTQNRKKLQKAAE